MVSRDDVKRIRREFTSRGLMARRPGRRLRGKRIEGDLDWADRVAAACEGAGPLFVLFGHYLSNRPDWLPLRDCRRLRQERLTISPTPVKAVIALLDRVLPSPPDEVFSSFVETPRFTSFLHQWHVATLADDTDVVLKMVRPEAQREIDDTLELLHVLEDLEFNRDAAFDGDRQRLVEDFVQWLERETDLGAQCRGLAALGEEDSPFDVVATPKIFPRLCSAHLSVTEDLGGTRVDQLLSRPEGDRPDPARRICRSWLEEALLNGRSLSGPTGPDVSLLDDGRLGVAGGQVVRLDAHPRRHLLQGLAAAARDEPDLACEMTILSCEEAGDEADADALLTQFRQAEAFRSGGWTEEHESRDLAKTIFVHWRLARRAGFEMKPHTVAFLHGLTEVEAVARSLAPDYDTLSEALDDIRVVAAAVEVRENLGPTRVEAFLVEFLPMARDLFTDMVRLKGVLGRRSTPDRGKGKNLRKRALTWPAFVGGLLVSSAVALIATTLIEANPDLPWVEPTVAGAFVAVAALLVFVVGRPRDR